MDVILGVQDISSLTGMTPQHIRRLAKCGKLPATSFINEKNRPEYSFLLTAQPKDIQEKYYTKERTTLTAAVEPEAERKAKPAKAFDCYTAEEREEIVFWERVLAEWNKYRQRGGMNAAELDKRFLAYLTLEYPDKKMSIGTLYRKRKALAEGDLDGLVDGRGKARRGRRSMDPEVWDMYRGFLLQEKKALDIRDAMRLTEEHFEVHDPEKLPLPSYSTFRRRTYEDIPPQVLCLNVYGEKALKDEFVPHVNRDYNPMRSNDWWVLDNHTFDVRTAGSDGELHRLYLTAFIDARSGVFTGWCVSDQNNANTMLLALKRGILERGVPLHILTDNGPDFTAWDVGGRGFRRKNKNTEADQPPTIMEHLGIEFHTAAPHNAQAKPIERRFLDVKGQFSRLWATYTGGNVTEKPECLKKVLKNGHVPTDAEFIEAVDTLIRGFFNLQKYTGPVAADHKYLREDVFTLRMGEQRRPATEEDLRLMMMRTMRPQTVGQRGVRVKYNELKLEYFTQDFLLNWQKKKVYVRYDPDHLESCRVYTYPGDAFICELPLDRKLSLSWEATGEEVAEAAQYARQYIRRVKELSKANRVAEIDAQALVETRMAAAKQRLERYEAKPNRAPIRLMRAEEKQYEPPLLQAVGQIDLVRANQNAIRMKGETDNGNE